MNIYKTIKYSNQTYIITNYINPYKIYTREIKKTNASIIFLFFIYKYIKKILEALNVGNQTRLCSVDSEFYSTTSKMELIFTRRKLKRTREQSPIPPEHELMV